MRRTDEAGRGFRSGDVVRADRIAGREALLDALVQPRLVAVLARRQLVGQLIGLLGLAKRANWPRVRRGRVMVLAPGRDIGGRVRHGPARAMGEVAIISTALGHRGSSVPSQRFARRTVARLSA